MYNHESPLRGEDFVTKKIVKHVAEISKGKIESFKVGNVEARKDWSFAGDFAVAMWRMLQLPSADDYILSSEELHSVMDIIDISFKHCGIDIEWSGEGVNTVVKSKLTGRTLVSTSSELFRPVETKSIPGDCSYSKLKLDYKQSRSFEQLIQEMVDYELQK